MARAKLNPFVQVNKLMGNRRIFSFISAYDQKY